MKVFHGFDQVKSIGRPVVTIGSFDGVHQGHREIIHFLNREARRRNGESVVITFDPHPRSVLFPEEPFYLLNTLTEKLELLEEAGADNVVIIPFDRAFSRITAGGFVRDYLVKKLSVDTLIVGYNHHLGYNKEGDTVSLKDMSDHYGFQLVKMPKQEVSGHKVSSTVIREMIGEGRVSEAAVFLGIPYLISGVYQNGLLNVPDFKLLPPSGKYTASLAVMDRDDVPVQVSINENRSIAVKGEEMTDLSGPVKIRFIKKDPLEKQVFLVQS